MGDTPVPCRRAGWAWLLRSFVGALVVVLAVGVTSVSADTGTNLAPETTTPATTSPAPSTAAPSDSTVPDTGGVTEPRAADDRTSVSAIGVVIGIVGIVVLIGIAAWWMVRRDDEDEAPRPPDQTSYGDLI